MFLGSALNFTQKMGTIFYSNDDELELLQYLSEDGRPKPPYANYKEFWSAFSEMFQFTGQVDATGGIQVRGVSGKANPSLLHLRKYVGVFVDDEGRIEAKVLRKIVMIAAARLLVNILQNERNTNGKMGDEAKSISDGLVQILYDQVILIQAEQLNNAMLISYSSSSPKTTANLIKLDGVEPSRSIF